VLRKPDGSSRGFGFVTFEDEVSVEKCLVMEHHLAGRRVDVKRAVGKDGDGGGGGSGGPGAAQRGACARPHDSGACAVFCSACACCVEPA
jgi:RNA recognition motif-containing protein